MNRISLIEKNFALLIIAGSFLLIEGCQGRNSPRSPIHLNPNMDQQPRYDPQSESKFFIDGSTMRQPVEGTIAQDGVLYDEHSKFAEPSFG